MTAYERHNTVEHGGTPMAPTLPNSPEHFLIDTLFPKWRNDLVTGVEARCPTHGRPGAEPTISATGCSWAFSPRKAMKIGGRSECRPESGEVGISHGASEAEQLFDPERA
jgi:hypothetical protein